MKRCWIGAALLAGLLILALAVSWAMGEIHEDVEDALEDACEYALREDWNRAGKAFSEARQKWYRWSRLRASLADHNPVEQIDAGFSAAQVYGYTKDAVAFSSACRSLAKQVAAVGEAHELVWWNFL